MTPLSFDFGDRNDPLLVFLGAHSDDIEIGALATILELKSAYPGANVVWVVLGASGVRADEARASAEHCCKGFRSSRILTHSVRDGHFPSNLTALKDAFEALKEFGAPDLVLTHYRDDAHQDHRAVADVTWQTFRDHTILEYEIPKYDGDLGRPNVFSPVSKATMEEKLKVLESFFGSQRQRSWFTRDTFVSLMRLRGIECNSESGYAEAFYARKILLA